MSLGINATTSEGIVLAADSRQSYRNQKGMARIGSDSASKVFQLGKKVGLIVTGLAFLLEDNTLKNVSRFIEEFRSSHKIDELSIEEISKAINKFFKEKYNYKEKFEALKKELHQQIQNQGGEIIKTEEKNENLIISFKDKNKKNQNVVARIEKLQFLVSGYDNGDNHKTYSVSIPGEIELKRDSGQYGASWVGQGDVVSRIVLGFDSRMAGIPMMQKLVKEIGEDEFRKQIANMEYAIQWGTMTLQDAIDFSVLAIETTIAIQRFSDGIKGDPGDMPGVGGPIDVGIITKEGFDWVSQKKLKIKNNETNLLNS